MNLGIDGKCALVTASSAGMGRNIAHALAAEGVNVALFARTADKLKAVAQEIEQQHKVKAVPVAGDMLSCADVERLKDTLLQEFGGLDIFIMNTSRAPNPLRATLDENEDARWQQAYQNQLWSAIQVTKTVLPLMLDLFLKNSDFPGAQELAERAKKTICAPFQGQDPSDPEAQLAQTKALLAQFAQQASEETSHFEEIFIPVTLLYFVSAFAINRIAKFIEARVRIPGSTGAK